MTKSKEQCKIQKSLSQTGKEQDQMKLETTERLDKISKRKCAIAKGTGDEDLYIDLEENTQKS